jgi:hypothetical protein
VGAFAGGEQSGAAVPRAGGGIITDVGTAKPKKRGHFEFTPTRGGCREPDFSLEATSGDEKVLIAITEEKAVDSGWGDFTCTAVLPRAEAERLRDRLIGVLA